MTPGGRSAQPARAEYLDGVPAWCVRVVHPARFRGAPYSLRFALFALPQGALIACLLLLEDIPETPYFLHRVFDVAFPPVNRYLHELVEGGEWTLALLSRGSEGSVTMALRVDAQRLSRLLEQAEAFNAGLTRLDGAKALERFLSLFEPEMERSGCEAGWRAVRRRLADSAP